MAVAAILLRCTICLVALTVSAFSRETMAGIDGVQTQITYAIGRYADTHRNSRTAAKWNAHVSEARSVISADQATVRQSRRPDCERAGSALPRIVLRHRAARSLG